MAEENRMAPTIMLVEGQPETREMLRNWLEGKGYRIVEAADGQEALDLAPLARPDLIMMDVRLPKLNGIAVTRRLRQQPEFERVPIVAVSALDSTVFREAALSVGFAEYLGKPVDLDKLELVLIELLSVDARAAGASPVAPAT
jgi:CheY-like chemotaxis protein